MVISIKPHHFLDIIKLYGSGIEIFKPDEEFYHDFYKVANLIVNDKNLKLKLTIQEDDICSPCKFIGINGICKDRISPINGIVSKDEWNKVLDKRLIDFYELDLNYIYTSKELAAIFNDKMDKILEVWKEEDAEKLKKRHILCIKGIEKYIK